MGFLRVGLGPGPSGQSLIGTTADRGRFKNLMMHLVSFNASDPGILDTNGFPVSTPPSNVFGTISFASTLLQSETFVLSGAGVCNLQIVRGSPGFTNASVTVGGASCSIVGGVDLNLRVQCTANIAWRVQFQFATSMPTGITFNFLAGGSGTFDGTLRDLVFCRATDEASIAAATTPEELWSTEYVNVFQALSPKVIRPMGWTNPNSGNVSQSRYIADWQTSMNISSDRWEPRAWAGSTSGTDTYTCSSPLDATGSYVDGEMIQLKFINANTSTSVTVDSGGRGAVNLLRGMGSSTGTALAIGGIPANTLATLTYDALLNAFMYQAGGQTSCMPYELQIAFSNLVNAHYWCNFPSYFDDASVTAVATLVRTGLNPALIGYFEYANEIWNNIFPATLWSDKKGLALGFTSSSLRHRFGWYALRHRVMMGLVTSAWSPRSSSQLKRVIAFQAFGTVSDTDTYRLKGADLNGTSFPNYASAGYSDYDTAPNRPIDYCEALSYATYYSGAQVANFDSNYVSHGAAAIAALLTAADDYATGVPASMASALAFVDNDIRAGTLSGSGTAGGETLLALTSKYSAWNAVAVTHDKPIELYEGGHESWYPSTGTCTTLGISTDYGGSTGKIAVLLDAYKESAAFETLVGDQIDQFLAASKSTTWAWLILSGVNQWATMQTNDVFGATYKSWDAQVAFNH